MSKELAELRQSNKTQMIQIGELEASYKASPKSASRDLGCTYTRRKPLLHGPLRLDTISHARPLLSGGEEAAQEILQ